jgi:hypothetical protein
METLGTNSRLSVRSSGPSISRARRLSPSRCGPTGTAGLPLIPRESTDFRTRDGDLQSHRAAARCGELSLHSNGHPDTARPRRPRSRPRNRSLPESGRTSRSRSQGRSGATEARPMRRSRRWSRSMRPVGPTRLQGSMRCATCESDLRVARSGLEQSRSGAHQPALRPLHRALQGGSALCGFLPQGWSARARGG